jgi:hypothetical protein
VFLIPFFARLTSAEHNWLLFAERRSSNGHVGKKVNGAVTEDESEVALETINPVDPLAPLRELPTLVPRADLEAALRLSCARLVGKDALSIQLAREEMLDLLKARKVNSPAKLVDAALPAPEKKSESDSLVMDVTPHSEPVNGAALLDEIVDVIGQYLDAPLADRQVMALWTVFSHCFDSFFVCPILALTSVEMRCGKTTALTILGQLVPRALPASNISPAALFRSIEEWHPTLLIDEADTFLATSDELRGVINSGHTRASAFVLRVEGDDHTPAKFSTWAPKLIAAIGDLANTLEDRSFRIRLQRSHRRDLAYLRADRMSDFHVLRAKAARWAQDNAEGLGQADPSVPAEITSGRARDNWRTLFAVADAAEGHWPRTARDIARAFAGRDAASDSQRVRLLADIRGLFEGKDAPLKGREAVESGELVDFLVKIETAPWAESNRGRPLTMNGLARLLKGFEIEPGSDRGPIKPGQFRDGDKKRGYCREWFKDAFDRYLPPLRGSQPVQPVHPYVSNDLREKATGTNGDSKFATGTPQVPPLQGVAEFVPVVPVENGGSGDMHTTEGDSASVQPDQAGGGSLNPGNGADKTRQGEKGWIEI